MLALVATPAPAGWVGDVADVAEVNTIRVLDANGVDIGTSFTAVLSAYDAMDDGYTMLMGPGSYTWTSTPSWSKSISLIGSGSGEDPAGNTVWTGVVDGSGMPTSDTFLSLCGLDGYTVKDFRLANSKGNGLRIRDSVVEENLTELAANFVFENMAFVNLGNHGSTSGDGGWDDGIQIARTTANITVKNSLFDGDGPLPGYNGMNGIRLGNGGIQNSGLYIEGNTFRNLKVGVGLNGYKADNIRILNNTFSNISEFNMLDEWNSWGNAGVLFYPRRSSSTTADAWVKDVVIAGNTFQDIGYLPDEPNNLDPHPWEDTLLHEAGIGFTLASGTTVENVMIRDNAFLETPADGVMKRAINIVVSDANDYSLDGLTWEGQIHPQTWTGVAGTLKDVVVDNNTYAGVNAIRGIQWSSTNPGDPNAPRAVVAWLGQPDLYVKNANGAVITGIDQLGDVDNDNDIDAYDVTNLDQDLDGDGNVDDDDKVYLLTKALKTQVGDFNLDGKVDGLDFLRWQSNFNQPGTKTFDQGDGNFDGKVDGLDFLKWQAGFPTATNFFYPSGSGAAVPEPATLALLALGGLAAPRRRRQDRRS